MIEAQKAATEGAHVAIPEGLVPAMQMTSVVTQVHAAPRLTLTARSFDLFLEIEPHSVAQAGLEYSGSPHAPAFRAQG